MRAHFLTHKYPYRVRISLCFEDYAKPLSTSQLCFAGAEGRQSHHRGGSDDSSGGQERSVQFHVMSFALTHTS